MAIVEPKHSKKDEPAQNQEAGSGEDTAVEEAEAAEAHEVGGKVRTVLHTAYRGRK